MDGKSRYVASSAGSADGVTIEIDQHAEWPCPGITASARAVIEARRDPRPVGTSHKQITVFLMPGVHYHDLASYKMGRSSEILGLARFRYSLDGQIRFVLIRYPNWREMIAAKVDFSAIVESALRQICCECDDGPIYLAGHSFGGLVAFDTAHRLVALGRRVAFLGLLDTWGCDARSLKIALRRIRDLLRRKDVYALLRLTLRILIALRAFKLLQRVADFCMRIGGISAGIQITALLRCYPLRYWQGNAISVSTFLFRCEDHRGDGSYDYGWSNLCSRFRVISVGGDHVSMFSPRHVPRLASAFVRALRAADIDN
jgi:thioesterase domain-containing protein